MEPAGAERHRRSPEGEFAGASESIEPARRKKASSSNETQRNIEAGAGIEPAMLSLAIEKSIYVGKKNIKNITGHY
jgi:hypothetical protein